jgi:hypothetical protein
MWRTVPDNKPTNPLPIPTRKPNSSNPKADKSSKSFLRIAMAPKSDGKAISYHDASEFHQTGAVH